MVDSTRTVVDYGEVTMVDSAMVRQDPGGLFRWALVDYGDCEGL